MTIKLAAVVFVLAMLAIPTVADNVDRWIRDLNDTSPSVRETAASALKELNDTRAVEPLILALKDEDTDVRSGAAEALGKLGDTRAVEPLILA
ncbi:MAG: HEAT repeat domain-containing protein, partial [Methanothrix sp.]